MPRRPALIKQYLDFGVQTLLVPMVQPSRRPPSWRDALSARGIRGMGGARALALGPHPELDAEAQRRDLPAGPGRVARGLANLDAIAAVDGVDGVFIGPADLSASLGHVGNPMHPEVQAAIEAGIATVRAGKAPGILTPIRRCRAATSTSALRSSPSAWIPTC